MRRTIRIAALALVLAALAVIPAGTELRAHSPGGASLTALTVTAGSTAQTLTPAFSSTVYAYTVYVANDVAQVTIAGTPDGDGAVTYQYTDAVSGTDGHQVNLPTLGPKSISVVVTHTAAGLPPLPPATQIYTVRVIREGTVATDRAALVALYNSTGGASWTHNDNWGSTEPLSTWYQVHVDGDGRVFALGLGLNNLVGTLPTALGHLDRMQQLILQHNRLSGSIPNSLGNLTRLTTLYLDNNALSGSIPASLGDLGNLAQLSLWGNQLTGAIPDSLGNLASLEYLYLGGNGLSGSVPASLGNLANLLELSFWGNRLEGALPDSLGNLTNLTWLDISKNSVSGQIPDLGRLTDLKWLYLQENALSGAIPDSLGSLARLVHLYLDTNALEGAIPATLGNLSNLTTLSLHTNELNGAIPDSLGDLGNLESLWLFNNKLSGAIPATLGNLSSLIDMRLYNNQLDGEIPSALGRLSNLIGLQLHVNELSGDIPDSLGDLTSLVTLNLHSNQLTGEIPDSLGDLTSLAALYLHNNQLEGPIPDLSGASLEQVDISLNQLTGTIPTWLGSQTALTGLSLWGNQLTGQIPVELGSLTSLEILFLHENRLSGDFPAALGSLTGLNASRFASNTDSEGNPSLTGCVPLGLRYLLDVKDHVDLADRFEDLPAQDFIAEDANGDGDTDDPSDTPGLGLPFCMLSALTFSDVSLDPAFTSATAAYTASVANTVASTTVTATLDADAESSDRLSIRKGTASYTSGAAVPLAVGSNEITVTVTPTDGTPTLTYTATIFREGEDRATLMALYNSTGGASWTDKTGWGESGVAIGTWYGVSTDGNGRVTDLELSGNNLRGTLPADLGTLSNLITLDLSDNRLSGAIPDLTALTRLTTLNLGDNQMSGTIPGDLGSLTGLKTLSLRGNGLTGAIPEELGDLTDLDALYLDKNQLTGPIPATLGDLNQLAVTRFAGNTLTGCVPDGLRYLVTALDYNALPAQDFIADDANDDGDTDDDGDTPGLGLPFCTLSSLALSGVTLDPVFASDTVIYTASADHNVTSPTVTATPYDFSDTVSIIKGADSYTSGAQVPLAVGPNVITIEVTPADDTPTHTYTVTVTRAPNTAPAFDEGETTTRGVDENTVADEDIGEPVAASDTENDSLTYSLDATSAESFDIDASSGQLRTKADLDFEDKSSYTVTVSVRDGKDDNGDADDVTDDTITVTILLTNLNEAPEFPISETGIRDVDENTLAGEDIGAPVAATDEDGDTLTYTLDVPSRASFDIVATTGQLQTKAALDYETGSTSYSVTVTATDPSGADDTIPVTITVNNVDEAGTVTLSSTQPIDGTPLNATLDDPDDVSGSVSWSWARSLNGTSSWTPRRVTGIGTYTPVATDVGHYLRATASYTDGEGSGKSAQAISANAVEATSADPNAPPEFPSSETRARNVDENTPASRNIGAAVAATDPEDDTLTYSLDATGAASFDINRDTGQLQTKAALDYETTTHHFVTVTATDTAGGTAIVNITITVNNVEEPGTVTLSSLQPLVAIPLTATLADPDRVSSNVTWSWTRSPSGTSDWTLITGADSASYTPIAGDAADYLQATATYTDEEGGGKSAQAISANAVAVAPGRNKPVFREHPTAARSVTRNTPAGTNIGAPLTATDADNDALTYSLGGRDRDGFDIDASSGQLLTKAVLAGITRPSYTVFVSVSDGKDDEGNPEPDPQVDATTEVTITVTTPRRSGGGGGGGFGGPILTVTAVVAGDAAPAGLSFEFAYTCANTRGELLSTRTFTVASGRSFGLLIAAGLSCSLAATEDGGATAVDGLFTDLIIPPAGYTTTVTFTFGAAPTAVPLDAETVVEESGVSLTIPEGSRDAAYSVLLEADSDSCAAALDLEDESITCYTVTLFDAEGGEETSVTLLVPATITITLDATRVEELGGIDGVRAARERGELRMLQRADAESPWRELPFTVEGTDDGAIVIVVSVQSFSDFALVTATPRTQTVALHAGWTVVVWDGADGASILDALGGMGASAGGSDVSAQVGVVYYWLAETQTWGSFRPGAPAFLNAFDSFTRGATYWVRSSEAVEWTVVGGPLEPPAAEPTRLHPRWTEVVWRGADGAAIAEAFGADVFPQVEVIYRWLAETQTWGSFRPGAPAFLNAFDTFASGASYWIAVAEAVDWAAP